MGNYLIIIPTAISTNMLLLYGLCMREKTEYPVMMVPVVQALIIPNYQDLLCGQ